MKEGLFAAAAAAVSAPVRRLNDGPLPCYLDAQATPLERQVIL